MWRFCLAFLIVTEAAAAAQIVNVQSLVAAPGPDDGLSGAIEGTLDWRTGNTDLLDLAGSLVLRYKSGPHLGVVITRGEIGYALGERIVAKSFEHVRYVLKLTDLLSGETYIQHEVDEFRRLALRALVGIGPRFQLIDEKEHALALGISYMFEHETLASVGEPDDGDDITDSRLSAYATGRVAIDKNLELLATVYVQPRVTDFGDIRILQETALVIKVTERLSFKTEFSLNFDSRPPIAVKELDTALKSTISVKL